MKQYVGKDTLLDQTLDRFLSAARTHSRTSPWESIFNKNPAKSV